MAVTGKTASPHEIPYFEPLDHPPDMAAVTKAIAERTAARLDAIAPKQIVGATKKQLLIANASGVVTAITASGDVTNDESGVFSIGPGKVTSDKAKLTSGEVAASGDLTFGSSGSYFDVPGTELKLTPAVASRLLIVATFDFNLTEVGGEGAFGTVRLDTTDQAPVAHLGTVARATATQTYALSLTAAEHTIKLRAKKATNAEKLTMVGANTRFTYLLVAA